MKLLLDQGLPRGACVLLAASGIEAVHVGDIGMAQVDDSLILEEARNRGGTVVTLDADFHHLLAMTHALMPSVIRIRVEGLKREALATLLVEVVARCKDELIAGAVVSVDASRVRVRMLPLP